MTDPGLVAGLVLVSCVVATGLHEATHYATARLLGRPATVAVRDCAVYYGASEKIGGAEYAIAGAPVVVGTVVGAAALAAPVAVEWWMALPWAWYTAGGVRNDFAFRSPGSSTAE